MFEIKTNTKELIKSDGEPKVLEIDLKNLSSIASTVLSDKVKYEKLVIKGNYDKDTENSDLCERFWHTMGSTITELVIDSSFSIWLSNCTSEALARLVGAIFDHFVCLKRLKINSSCLHYLSPEFYMRNKELEIIDIFCEISYIKYCAFDNSEDSKFWKVFPEFENFFKYCSCLKRISFPCISPYNAETLDEAIAFLTNKYLRVDEVSFEFDPLSFDTGCYISKMEIEFDYLDDGTKKAIVEVIDIKIWENRELRKDLGEEESICVFEHNIFMSKTIVSIAIDNTFVDICLKCLECMIKSFPNVRSVVPYKLSDNIPSFLMLQSTTITLMAKHMPHLNQLDLSYSESLKLWPVFKQLKYLNIKLSASQLSDGIVHLCQCCPNLEEFRIEFETGALYVAISEIVSNIAKHLVKLKVLEIDPKLIIGGRSIKTICVNLKQLTTLTIGCNEDSQDLLELFKELPQLERIKYKTNIRWESLTREDYQRVQELNNLNHDMDMNSRDALEILPEEIWDNIFQSLTIHEQVTCRRVCKRWWNILSTYRKYLRRLPLKGCVLEMDSNPVKTFINSEFNYNRLSLQGPVIIHINNLNDFWRHLGKTINEICFRSEITAETWSQLVNSGMTIENLSDLESIRFHDLETFSKLLSHNYDAIAPTFQIIKKLFTSFKDSTFNTNIWPDMPNLEYAEVHLSRWRYLDTFSKCLTGRCSKMYTLDIVSYEKCELIPNEVSIFRQLKNLKINGIPNIEELEFSLNDCINLKSLTIQDGLYDSKKINFREIAINLFKRLPNLGHLLILSSMNKINLNYKLELKRYVKNIVEYDYSVGHLSNNIVHTEKTAADAPTFSVKRFKSK